MRFNTNAGSEIIVVKKTWVLRLSTPDSNQDIDLVIGAGGTVQVVGPGAKKNKKRKARDVFFENS